MLRLLVSACLFLLANAVGIIAAAWVLPGFSIDTQSIITVVVLFTFVEVIADPLLLKISIKSVPQLRGGIALVTTLVGLVITNYLSDGLTITGFTTWIIATLIVWLMALAAGLVLPLFLFKKVMQKRGS
jgi:putative membrane protein